MKFACINKRKRGNDKGSITLETAILLPIFIAAMMSFIFIIKVYYAHETVQQAITGACNEISVYSLLYYETNAEEVIGGIERLCNSDAMGNLIGDSEIAVLIRQFGKDTTDYLRAQLALIPVAKYLVNRNLGGKAGEDGKGSADRRLKALNLAGGFEGIDFSESRMLADGKSIDIVVSYQLRFPFLSGIFPGVKITQAASSCIWAGENGVLTGEYSGGEGVWDMNNLARGREIRKLQGANLPFNFPGVAIFTNGTAVSIKSMNVDEEYYHNANHLKQKIVFYIKQLENFDGGESGNVSIKEHQILNKELRLIIPETELKENQKAVMDECMRIADSKGIRFNMIKAYGRQNQQNKEEADENVD